MKYRLEYSLLLALAVTLLYCAILPDARAWWGTAFSPLCDGVLTAEGAGGEIILKSKLWELLMQLKT